jgi:hypothetical protein
MNGIFISYRRDDTSHAASRLHKDLCAQFGEKHIFVDVHQISPGEDFAEKIYSRMDNCQVLLALIGKQWLDSKDAVGNRRLDNPQDFVRLEIETALQRGIPVVPILFDGVSMPTREKLPSSLEKLTSFQAQEIAEIRWDHDVSKLMPAIVKACGLSWKKYVTGSSSLAAAAGGGWAGLQAGAFIIGPVSALLAGQIALVGGGALLAGIGTYKLVKKGLKKI